MLQMIRFHWWLVCIEMCLSVKDNTIQTYNMLYKNQPLNSSTMVHAHVHMYVRMYVGEYMTLCIYNLCMYVSVRYVHTYLQVQNSPYQCFDNDNQHQPTWQSINSLSL